MDSIFVFDQTVVGFKTFSTMPALERIHQMYSPICFTNFSQAEQLKKKTNFLLVQNSFFSVCSWKRNHNKYSLKKFVDSEFESGENIWWIVPKMVMIHELPDSVVQFLWLLCVWNCNQGNSKFDFEDFREMRPLTSSSHVFTNPESTKPDFFPMKFVLCFDLFWMDFHLTHGI